MYDFLKYTSYILVLVGAINWGLVGAFNFDLVAYLFGDMTLAARIVYIVIGICAIISAITAYLCHKRYVD